MNDPTMSGTPPSVEGIVTRPSPFSVEETLERLQEIIRSRNLTLFANIDHSGGARQRRPHNARGTRADLWQSERWHSLDDCFSAPRT